MQAKKGKQLVCELSPTQEAFVFSEALINVLVGPMGEGKTYASAWGLVQHGQRNGRPIRCAIIRDTHENIKVSTARSIQETLRDLAVFKNDFHELTIRTDPKITVDLFGIDDPAALSRLQGTEYACIWLEEPAPMADKANAGLSESVYNAALSRCVRQSGCVPRLQVSMNPADEDHWTYRRLIEAPDMDPENDLITKAVFNIPHGENSYLTEKQRQATRAAYKDDPAATSRYVLGTFAKVYRGKQVTPEYNPDWHLSKVPLKPADGLVGFRCFDGWHDPVCMLGQISLVGRLIFIDVLRGENTDVGILIKHQVVPLLESPRWKDRCKAWRTIGDVSMMIPDQSNKDESAAKVVTRMLGGFFEPGPKLWTTISRRVKNGLEMNIGNRPAIELNREHSIFDRTLGGGWHYPTDNSGNINRELPEKDMFSHVGDCFANAVSVLLPYEAAGVDVRKMREADLRTRRRISSYVQTTN